MVLLPVLLSLAIGTIAPPETPAVLREQQFDAICRERLPFGQGDLQGALLTLLRECVNDLRRQDALEQSRNEELQRLSIRANRDSERRATILARMKRATLSRSALLQTYEETTRRVFTRRWNNAR